MVHLNNRAFGRTLTPMSSRFLLLPVLLTISMIFGCASTPASKSVGTGPVDPSLKKPLEGQPGDVAVLIFASPDCPISNALAPEYQRIHEQLVEGGGRMYLVHARGDVTRQIAEKHAEAYKLKMDVLLDPDQYLVEKMNATVTPEAVVLRIQEDGSWKKVYQGRINDLYASLGNRRDHPTQYWLREAIDASFNDQVVEVAYRAPLGCYIERIR